MVGHRDAADDALVGDDFVSMEQVVELGKRIAGGGACDLDFFGFGRIIELDEKHEAVELGFRERVGAFLFDRILSGEDEERLLERKCFADGGDFVFLHGLEHGGLRFLAGHG